MIVYQRNADGSLRETQRIPTGGRGSGGNNDPLESQGSLTLSEDHSLLFAVNAGSGEVSMFRVEGSTLSRSDKVPSFGSEPNAIAQHGDLVYVLNTGGSSNVVGFHLEADHLRPIDHSIAFLSTNTSGAASIAISPDGQFLAVTERLTNSIDVFRILGDGTLSPIVVNPSIGPGAFSVSFAPDGVAIVSETGPANVPNGSAVSSYAVASGGTLEPITSSVPTLGAANCWNAISPDGRFVYVSNAGSSTISGFVIGANGSLLALPGTVVAANPAGATNLDITVSADGKFLYTLNSRNGTIGIFAIEEDGTLKNAGSAGGSLRIPDSMELQQTKLSNWLLSGRLQVIAGVRSFPGRRVCTSECSKKESFSSREYFLASPVHHSSRIARQLSEMNWSIAHERREASFWISVRDEFTCNTFSK